MSHCKTWIWLLLGLTLHGALSSCAAAAGRKPDVLGLATPEARRAKLLAADLHARAAGAAQAASVSRGPGERATAAARARAWLVAAELEADRVDAERARARMARKTRAVRAELAEVQAELARAGAALNARKLAARSQAAFRHADALSLESLQALPGSRKAVRGDPALGSGPNADTVEVSQQLVVRARLNLSAARLLHGSRAVAPGPGAPAQTSTASEVAEQTRAEQLLADLSSPPGLRDARALLTASQAALGAVRARAPQPDGYELASLLEAAVQRELQVCRTESAGVRVAIPDFAFGRGALLSSAGRVLLGRLDELLRLHPHGPARIEMHVPSERAWPLAPPALWARARGVARALAGHRRRIQIGRPVGHFAGPPALFLALPAYDVNSPTNGSTARLGGARKARRQTERGTE